MWFDDWTGTTTFELVYHVMDMATMQPDYYRMVPVFVGRSKYWRDFVIDKNGTAHLVFNLRSPTESFYTKNPTPMDDSKWTAPVPVSGNTDRDWAWPRMAVDNAGDVYVVWYANTGGYESGDRGSLVPEDRERRLAGPGQPVQQPDAVRGLLRRRRPREPRMSTSPGTSSSPEGNWEIYLRMYSDSDRMPGATSTT